MNSPDETIQTYLLQLRSRVRWLVVSVLAGVAVVAVVHLATDIDYPAIDIVLLVSGFVFWPFFVWQVNRKDAVSTLAAWRAGGGSTAALRRDGRSS